MVKLLSVKNVETNIFLYKMVNVLYVMKQKKLGRPLTVEETITPEEAFLYATTKTQEAISLGWAGNYLDRVKESMKSIEKYKEALKYYEKLEKEVPREELWKLKQELG